MKSTTWNPVIAVSMLLVLAFACANLFSAASRVKAANSSGLAARRDKARRLEGTWSVEVTIRDCETDAALKTFPAFLTFAQGGTLVETTTGFPPSLRSPGHGFWQQTGGNTFTAVSEAFLFNPSGVWTGTQRLTQSIKIGNDPDELSSNATNEIFDPNGNLITSGCATAVAHRAE
jgi:hypothetical protein